MDKRARDVLSTTQITTALSRNKITAPHFIGVFSFDSLPKEYIEKRPGLIVVNTAFSASVGEHWVALFLSANSVEYFDSFGLPPNGDYIMSFIAVNDPFNTYTFNTVPLQSMTATTCGKFAALFLYFRTIGCSIVSFIKLMSINPDSKARKLYARIFGGGGKVGCGGQICYKYGGGKLF